MCVFAVPINKGNNGSTGTLKELGNEMNKKGKYTGNIEEVK